MAIEKPQLKRRWRIRNSARQAILFIGDLILSYFFCVDRVVFLVTEGLAEFFWRVPLSTGAILVLPVTCHLDPVFG
jgi:hypothetical protein